MTKFSSFQNPLILDANADKGKVKGILTKLLTIMNDLQSRAFTYKSYQKNFKVCLLPFNVRSFTFEDTCTCFTQLGFTIYSKFSLVETVTCKLQFCALRLLIYSWGKSEIYSFKFLQKVFLIKFFVYWRTRCAFGVLPWYNWLVTYLPSVPI